MPAHSKSLRGLRATFGFSGFGFGFEDEDEDENEDDSFFPGLKPEPFHL